LFFQTAEAAVVQIFNEAKRHKPSILFIPALVGWAHALNDAVKATVKGLLDSLDPSEPILLLALAEAPFSEVPSDVKSWFGFLKNNRIKLAKPNEVRDFFRYYVRYQLTVSMQEQRSAFFENLLTAITRKPTEYPDAMPRKKRILEELPKAPPLPPREPTAAELAQQVQADERLKEYFKFRIGPVIVELKRRHKRFSKPINVSSVYR
jgi:SpoVK/Ycf46/Vps4 family AAA+-type ATPase